MAQDDHPCCYGGHCCVLHGCKYGDDDCPIVLETRVQEGGCETCSMLHSGEKGDSPYGYSEPEFDDAPYGCPRCGSSRIIFSGAYDIPKGTRPTEDSPFRYFVLCLACKHDGQWADFKGHKDRNIRRQIMSNPLNMGHLVEGVVEQDPMTDRYVIRTDKGSFDPQEVLAGLKGKTVRMTLVDFDTLQKLAEMVEANGESVVPVLGLKKD